MKIADPETLKDLPNKSRSDIDNLDFGVIKADDNGIIQLYNKYETTIANYDPASVEGKNFFTEVAPCTDNRIFHGQFKKGVANNNLDTAMPYTFTYKISPTNVNIQMYRDNDTKTNWILVKKR